MTDKCDVAIIGAGPYGLSLAAHLAAQNTSFRIFGEAMSTWRHHMPEGMQLKSDGFASNLSAPHCASRLSAWCAANGVAYSPKGAPVARKDFVAYADWFARTHVPTLETVNVTNLARASDGFVLSLESGERFGARQVVVATGISSLRYLPSQLDGLSPKSVSHSFDHHRFDDFAGKDVIVLGAGASAIDTAIGLQDAGAHVKILARRKTIAFHSAPDNEEHTRWKQIQRPSSGIGPGWRSFFCANAPLLFHQLPQSMRLEITRRHLGPAPGWFTRHRVEGRIPYYTDQHLLGATIAGGRVALDVVASRGHNRLIMTDHVIAATGYRADLSRLAFLDKQLCNAIAQVESTPILFDNFESSIRGLYFVGLLAANSFGPLLRFMHGVEFVSPRLASELRARATLKRKAA